MNETEWETCTDSIEMLKFVDETYDQRKVFLYGLACCRAIWPLLPQPEMQKAVEVAEDFAEGTATEEELSAAEWQLEETLYAGVNYYRDFPDLTLPDPIAGWLAGLQALSAEDIRAMSCCGGEELPSNFITLLTDASYFVDHVLSLHRPRHRSSWNVIQGHYSRFLSYKLIREIFGNPFRKVTIVPEILDWSNGILRKMAAFTYENRSFDRLPILGDALIEAGCSNNDIVKHCNRPGGHVRGCWVLDLVLGKSSN